MKARLTKIGHCRTINEVLDHARLNFIPVQQDMMTLDGVNITGFKGIYRSDTKQTLSVMGSDYTPFPPAQTFAIADTLNEKYGTRYKNAYGLDGGKRIVIELEHPETTMLGGREHAKRRIQIIDSLDGSTKFMARAGIWRMVCSNGMYGWAYENTASIRHTKNAQNRLQQAMRVWAISVNTFEQIEITAAKLMQKTVDKEMVEKFLDEIVGKVDSKTSTRKKNQRFEIEQAFLRGRGNHGQTAWDLVNGVTEYYQHTTNQNDPEARTASAMFGTGKSQADKAVKLALSL